MPTWPAGRAWRAPPWPSASTRCSPTSFANPAITVGRTFSDTFAGIAPASVPGFVVAQLVGGVVAVGAIRTLYPDITPAEAAEVVVAHDRESPNAVR